MAYLIDGNNVLGYTSSCGSKGASSRLQLIRQLAIFQKVKKSRVLLVFDGPPEPNFACGNPKKNKFAVLSPPPGENADSLIKEFISGKTDVRRLTLVSSDRELRAFAREKGAKTLSSKEFHTQLKKVLGEYRKARELEKKDDPLSPLTLRLWEEAFTPKK